MAPKSILTIEPLSQDSRTGKIVEWDVWLNYPDGATESLGVVDATSRADAMQKARALRKNARYSWKPDPITGLPHRHNRRGVCPHCGESNAKV